MILRVGTLSLRSAPRSLLVQAALIFAVLLAAAASLRLGSYPIATSELLELLRGGGADLARMIVLENRLPRLLVALGAGAAFGLAGALFQTMLRNPLASPDWIGFTPGASFGALLAIYLTGGNVVPGALLGTLAAALLVLGLALDGGLSVRRLVVVGIGVNLTIAAGADLLLARVDMMTASDMAAWLVGSLNGRDWEQVRLIWGALVFLAPLSLLLSFPLSAMMLGDDLARGQGIALQGMRLLITGTAILLVALGVCVAGPLPFVAFLSGPIAKAVEGGRSPAILSAALIGALVVALADQVTRLIPLVQLPAGVFTALIGAPCLLWLVLSVARKGKI
jgi:iron complex transport system permease protein